jgi:hypothetical protein
VQVTAAFNRPANSGCGERDVPSLSLYVLFRTCHSLLYTCSLCLFLQLLGWPLWRSRGQTGPPSEPMWAMMALHAMGTVSLWSKAMFLLGTVEDERDLQCASACQIHHARAQHDFHQCMSLQCFLSSRLLKKQGCQGPWGLAERTWISLRNTKTPGIKGCGKHNKVPKVPALQSTSSMNHACALAT